MLTYHLFTDKHWCADAEAINLETRNKNGLSYLLKVVGNKHKVHAAETQLGYTQENIDEVSKLR